MNQNLSNLEPVLWDTHFTKGWTDEQLWRDYMQARDAKAYFEMDCILRSQNAQRRPVDARIWATNPKDADLYHACPSEPDAVGSAMRDQEHEQLVQLASLRDVRLEDLPEDLPESLRKNSYFAKLISIRPYTPEVDYMTTKDEYDFIQAGNNPARGQETLSIFRSPETGRDWATYVHKDDPMVLWTQIVQELMRLGVPMRQAATLDTVCREDAPFVTGGMPFWWGLIGDVIDRIGPINFMSKHLHMAARPEEYAVKRFGDYLPMAFAEGSPMHGSFRAMHDAIARAEAAAVAYVADEFFEMPNGNSLGYELDLIAGNVSDGRQWAAVHTQADNRKGNELARKLGERVAKEHLERLGSV